MDVWHFGEGEEKTNKNLEARSPCFTPHLLTVCHVATDTERSQVALFDDDFHVLPFEWISNVELRRHDAFDRATANLPDFQKQTNGSMKRICEVASHQD